MISDIEVTLVFLTGLCMWTYFRVNKLEDEVKALKKESE